MIFYINNYYNDAFKTKREPLSFLAAKNKIEYILYLLKCNKFDFFNISYGFTKNTGIFKKEKFSDEFIYLPCVNFCKKNKYNIISLMFMNIFLFIYILRNISKDDVVILYHEPLMMPVIKLAKFIKKFKLILEVEELYFTNNKRNRIKNFVYKVNETLIIKSSDAYITVNDLVKRHIDNITKGKNSIICYGNYNLVYEFEKMRSSVLEGFTDRKIKILYSGLIDNVRGAFTVLQLAKKLENRYEIIITGYGEEEQLKRFTKEIDKINSDFGYEKVKFYKELNNKDYLKVLRSSDICLNCQNDKDEFAKYSFPSKIINYLCFNKIVISNNMPSVINSKLAKCMVFADLNDLDDFAKKIEEIDINKQVSYTDIIKKLDLETRMNFKKLLNSLIE